MEKNAKANQSSAGPLITMVLSGMAGGMAWGIRGQYGHETGAMIAGVLVGFTLVLLHGRHLSSLSAARAIAMFALGISVGGSMTYGQTVGLTHDAPLIGNSEAYRWGMLGLAIKGGVWIALGSAMFGMALSGRSYRSLELGLLFVTLMCALFVGVYLLNRPFDPSNKLLPKLYFSDHWYWEPDVDKPRRERWGGLVAVLAVLLVYLGSIKHDRLALALGLWGLLGGAIGFPAGQTVQAFNAWHGEWIRSLPTSSLTQYFNWWNMMETTFGFVFGAIVGLGVWRHRTLIDAQLAAPVAEVSQATSTNEFQVWPSLELALALVHVWLLVAWNFQSIDLVDAFADLALPMIILPAILVMAGRFWPFLMALPIVLLPIAGKTVRQLVYNLPPEQATSPVFGWVMYAFVPLAISIALAIYFSRQVGRKDDVSRRFLSIGLLATTWLYFSLNHAFFQAPWPWKEWTGRTPNEIIFFAFAACLTWAAIHFGRPGCDDAIPLH